MDVITEKKQSSNAYIYKSNAVYTQIITVLFSLFALINVIVIIISTNLITHIDEDSIALFNFFYLIDFVLFIICGIFFLLWTYRANQNSHFLNPNHKFEFTPGWSVGAFFIPILNLYWPYKAIREIRLTSLLDVTKISTNVLLLVWWISFILRAILLRANASRVPLASEQAVQNYFFQSVILSIFAITSAILAVIIVRQINKAQKTRALSLNAFPNSNKPALKTS